MEAYQWFLLGMMAGLIPCFALLALVVTGACDCIRLRRRDRTDHDAWRALRNATHRRASILAPMGFARLGGKRAGRRRARGRTLPARSPGG